MIFQDSISLDWERSVHGILNASWKICSLAVNGQSFFGYIWLSVKSQDRGTDNVMEETPGRRHFQSFGRPWKRRLWKKLAAGQREHLENNVVILFGVSWHGLMPGLVFMLSHGCHRNISQPDRQPYYELGDEWQDAVRRKIPAPLALSACASGAWGRFY